MATKTVSQVLMDLDRWGLPPEAIERLPTALQEFWQRYRHHFRNSTRDPAPYAYHYLSALLRMKAKRYFAAIGRETGLPAENIQHFVPNSPWSARHIYQQIQDEFRAIKWRAWEHQTVLTALSLWFIAQVRLEWAKRYPRDTALAQELGVELLPERSVANVRELLRAVMPLRQLSPEEARRLVGQHLVHRARSRRSRLRKAMRLTPYPREPAK